MGRNQAQQHRTARSSGRGISAHRVVPRKSRPARAASGRLGPKRAARGRRAIAAGRRSRRPLLFLVLVASVAAQLAAAFAGSGALVALFTLLGLLLCAVVIHS
jgi:Flp pilus assembly protein TadB